MGHNLTVTCLVLLPKHVYRQLSNRVRYKPLARMRSDGYGGYPVCVCVSESTTILVLQATTRFMSDINSFSVISARKP